MFTGKLTQPKQVLSEVAQLWPSTLFWKLHSRGRRNEGDVEEKQEEAGEVMSSPVGFY